jgi:FGFR1 oncogene partner
MQEDNIDLQLEAKNLVLSELERNGVINYMRAKIKKSILDIINNEKESTKQKLDFDFMTPLHRLNKPKEIVLVCQLIKEFLKFYEMEYTLPIFENESNVKENIKRESLLKEVKLQGKKDDSKPVLLLLLMDKLNRPENVATGLNANKGASDRYDFNNFGSVFNRDDNSNPAIPNKKLAPINLGTTNRSLDMNNNNNSDSDKFNTFNISDVYKRDKVEMPKENNENKGKEITSADILGPGAKADNKLSEDIKKEEIKNKINPVDQNPEGANNKNEDDFKEVILEDLENNVKNSQEKKEVESQSFSTSNKNSQGVDSSAGPNSMNNFDYVEDVEKKV